MEDDKFLIVKRDAKTPYEDQIHVTSRFPLLSIALVWYAFSGRHWRCKKSSRKPMVDRWGFSACKHSLPNHIIRKSKRTRTLQLYQGNWIMGLKPDQTGFY
jgi:hypothetical protein